MSSVGSTAGEGRAYGRAIPPYPMQSPTLVFRDAMMMWLLDTPFFMGWTARTTKAFKVSTQHVPYLGLYFIRDNTMSDGDPNAGEVRLKHDVTYGFSVIVQNNDPQLLEAKLDEAHCVIVNTLWANPYLMNMLDTRSPHRGGSGTPGNVRMEGVKSTSRRHTWGTLENETPIGELQYEATLIWREDFEPVITDYLDEIHLRLGVKSDDTEEEMARRVQARTKYMRISQP